MSRWFSTSLLPSAMLLAQSAAARETDHPVALTAAAAPASGEAVVPVRSPERQSSLAPQRAEQLVPGRTTFDVDPIADGAIIGLSFGFAFVLQQIKSTGEIRPQQIAPDFDRGGLLAIDRSTVTATPSPSAGDWSNVAVGAAVAYAIIDPLLSAYREQSLQTWLVDAVLYAESLALTQATTNLVKLAVRRPRPGAYLEAEANRDDPHYANVSTDSALSFFSGHASTTASVGATATYLAFARSPSSWRPWATLVAAAGATTFVSVQRVRAGKHFPTDVIAGALAGAGIGIVVPHLHRSEDVKQRLVWVGYAPRRRELQERGGELTVSGVF